MTLYNSTQIDNLANHRAGYNGYNISIVNVENMAGYPFSCNGIRDFIKAVYDTRTAEHMRDGYLGFVLLIGDAFKDDNTTVMFWKYDGYTPSDEKASDHFYACLTQSGGTFDDLPDVMIGRLSVGNVTQLTNVVSKIINYETVYASGDWRDDILLFEGQGLSSYSQFGMINNFLRSKAQTTHFLYRYEPPHASANYLVRYNDVYPPPITNIDDATQRLINQFNSGRFMTNYECDHGSIFGWHPDGEGHTYTYFDVNDIASLANGSRLPFMLNVCCDNGWFDNQTPDPGFGSNVDCFAERLQYEDNRGAIAVLASSRWDYVTSYGIVDKYIYDAIFDSYESLVGGSVLAAKLRWSSKLRHKFNLFGDPSQNLYPQGLSSTSLEATAYNNSRKLICDSNGKYHLVLESCGEIFYQNSVNGNSWLDGIRLSSGNGNNKYPSITGTSTKQFAVWQRYTGYGGGQHKYDTYFAKNTGSGWTTTTITNLSNLGFSTQTNPLPVITYKNVSGVNRLIVCARTSSAIKYVINDNDGNPTQWSNATNLPSTTASHQNPGLSMGPTTPTTDSVYVAYDDGSTVYYNAYKSSWRINHSNISSGSGTSNNRYPSVEVDGSSGKNFAWQGYSTPLEMTVIVHRRNNEAFQIFANGGDGGNRPSITGLASNKRAIVCTSDNSTDIFKLYYNGSSWSRTLVASNGQHPTLSAGATTAKYAWTSGTAAPYEIKISTESLSKSSLENWAYHRAAVLQDTSHRSLLWIEVGEITLATSQQDFAIAQTAIQNQDLNLKATELFKYLDSEPFVIPADSTKLIWYQQLYGQGLSPLTATPTSDLKITTQLIDAATESELATLHQATLVSGSDSSRLKGALLQDVSAYKGRQVKIRVVVAGLAAKMAGVVPGVTEIHLLNPTGFNKPYPEKNDKLSAEQPETFRLFQNFPNPFNPATEIHYQLPEAAQVRLVIYTLLGQHIRTLVEQRQPAGDYSVSWDGRDIQGQNLASGIYGYRLEAGSLVASKKLVLIR